MNDPVVPLVGVMYPHHVPKVGPADHGVGRRCAICTAKVNRYTEPQPITGRVLCNQCWDLPSGYEYTHTGRVREIRSAA